jgi:predicted dehydrogenase
MKSYRVLICGAGSAGERHLRNLRALGRGEVALLRSRGAPLRTVSEKTPEFREWNHALADFKPDVAIVSNPTALHLETALRAAHAGCHVFVEKPLSHNLAGLAELNRILEANGRKGMVAYMMRFHPLLKQVKAWLEEGEGGTLGRPLYAHLLWAEHIPDWHPWEDYGKSYAVHKEQGGGAALTYSHDLDLCLWLFGTPRQVLGWPNQAAPLHGDAEQGFDLLMRFERDFTAHVHADYFTRPPVRRWELTATRGRVVFDYHAGTLTRFDGVVGEMPQRDGPRELAVETLRVPAGFERNDLFVEELRYFFDCLDRNVLPHPDIREGARVVQLSLASHEAKVRALPTDPFAPLI